MFCPNCGKELSEDSIFCPQCGTKVPATPSDALNDPPEQNFSRAAVEQAVERDLEPVMPPQQQPAPKPAKKKNKLPLVIGGIGAIILVFVLIVVLFSSGDATSEISTVRNGFLGEFTDMTADEVLDRYYSDLLGYEEGIWDSGITDDGTTIVQVDFVDEMLGDVAIQFSMLDEDCFKVTAFVDPLEDIEETTDLLAALNKIYIASCESQYPQAEMGAAETEILERLASVNATSVLYGAANDYEGDRSQLYRLFGDPQLEMSATDLLNVYGIIDGSNLSGDKMGSTSNDNQNISSNTTFSSGTFATSSNASTAYENGGIVVDLDVSGDQVAYTVTSISETQRIASISGVADQSNSIHVSGDDDWGNIVEGDIIVMEDNFISVEFTLVAADPNAMWELDCPYTILTRCVETETDASSSYPIQIRMDSLMSANILGDTFWSAYENGWLEEWMSLYVNGSSDPNILFEPFWYDEQLGEWTYYGITYSQAETAGWGSIWTEILANNGYSRY